MNARERGPQRPLVNYLVARDGLPPASGLAYDYVLAGDGLWLAAQNTVLIVRAPVARCGVRGLPSLGGACVLTQGWIPAWIWRGCAEIARLWAAVGLEILLLVTCDAEGRYALVVPEQTVSGTRVRYTPPELPAGTTVVLALHSHHRLPAYFSATDDGDEQGLALYGVLGRLNTPHPEVALRAGVYGAWLPVPWSDVFDGDRGVFRDAQFDSPAEAEPEAPGGDAARDDDEEVRTQ